MFSLTFCHTTKPRNSTEIPPLGGGFSAQGLLREDSSIIRPTFRIRFDYEGAPEPYMVREYNYLWCQEFNRYYFVTDVIFRTAVVIDIYCEVDVLATYRLHILDTNAFVQYAEGKYNAMIPDSRIPLTDKCTNYIEWINNVTFIENYSESPNGCFVLNVLSSEGDGSIGAASSYVLSRSDMSALTHKLYDEDGFEEIKQQFLNPLQFLLNCIWLPSPAGIISEPIGHELYLGKFNTGIAVMPAKRVVEGDLELKPYVPFYGRTFDSETNTWIYNYSDYRNCEPYTEYYVMLPGVGMVQLPMVNCIGNGEETDIIFNAHYAISPINGDITYTISKKYNYSGGSPVVDAPLLMSKGNLAIPVPVSQLTQDYAGNISSIIAGLGSIGLTAIGAVTGNPYMTAYGAMGVAANGMNAMSKAETVNVSSVGTLGGWSGYPFDANARIITRVFAISDIPGRIIDTIGRPLFRTEKLGDLKGLVKCTGAYVKAPATAEEHQMIAQYVNSSTNFIFGGLIIE